MSYSHYRLASSCVVEPLPCQTQTLFYTQSPPTSPPSATSKSSMLPPRDTWYSASPTIFSPPPHLSSHHAFPAANMSAQSHDMPMGAPAPAPAQAPVQPIPISMPMRPHAGRKRSRDEISGTLDEPHLNSIQHDPTLDRPPSPPKRPAVEPVYGPGMTLLYPGTGSYNPDAASQSGTWVEERDELAASAAANGANGVNGINGAMGNGDIAATRPVLESRKSQRLNGDAPGLDDIARAVTAEPPRSNVSEPVVDEATLTLGIGWTVMSNEMEAASRGWARFIENHYPLQSVRIFWQNKSLPAYLATAVCYGSPGYYLFDEDLDRCQMVAKSWERALDNLKALPPAFDGAQVLTARRAGGAAVGASAAVVNGVNGVNGQETNGMHGQDSGMDLD